MSQDPLKILLAADPSLALLREFDRVDATVTERDHAKAYFIGYLSGRLTADGQITPDAWGDGVAATIAALLREREEA